MSAVLNASADEIPLMMDKVAFAVDFCDGKNVTSMRQAAWLSFSSIIVILR